MAEINTYITEEGWNSLIKSGLLNSITSFKASDASIIYGIEENNIKPAFYETPLGGSREGATTIPTCSFSERTPIPVQPPSTQTIQSLDSRVKLAFVSEDCVIPFEKNNLTVRINVDKWIDNLLNLKSTTYVRTASGLKINVWDYISGYLEEYNSGTKTWSVNEEYKSNLDISYKTLSSLDSRIYDLVNPKYMEVNQKGQKVFVNGQTKTRFPSNMFLGFNSKEIDGINIFGTSNTLGLYPDSWGYVADGTYLLTGGVEDNYKQNPNSYKTIYPALKIDKKIYQLKENKNYTTTDGVGYMVWGYKDSDGNPAVNGLTDKLKLFMKANGTEESSGVYKMVINFMVDLKSDKKFNTAYQNKKVGGDLTYEFYYNENMVSTDLIKIS